MRLRFDPGLEGAFWAEIGRLPGYPCGETIRLRRMIFEVGAVRRAADYPSATSSNIMTAKPPIAPSVAMSVRPPAGLPEAAGVSSSR